MDLIQLLGGRMMWAGTEDSLNSLVRMLMPEQFRLAMESANIDRVVHERKIEQKAQAKAAARANMTAVAAKINDQGIQLYAGGDDDDEDDEDLAEKYWSHSATYEVIDGVAVIGISGNMVNSDKWYLRYLGQVGYPHIIDQLERAMNDGAASSIVMRVNSPGGAVSGISSVSDAIQAVRTVKPVTTYAEGMLCSAAYWVGCTGGHITATNLTEIGSIGVVVTHMEYSEMMKREGITPTIIRKGEFKMLATPYEKLSDKAITEIKHGLDVIYDAFTNHVALNRDVSQETVKTSMGEGRVFWGYDALRVNLIDKVGDMGSALAYSKSLVQTSPATTY